VRWYVWRQRLLEWLSVGLLAALLVAPLSLLAWLMFFTDTFAVQAVTIVDARPHTEEEVRGRVESAKGQSILFIQTGLIEDRLLAEIPQLRDVHIVRKLPATLKIIVQEKTPALLLLSAGKYHFVDGGGIVYEPARLENLPGIVLPVIKNNDSASQVTLGVRAVDPTFVQFVQTAQEKLPAIAGGQIAEIRIPSLAAREAHFLLNNNWTIRLDTTRSLDAQLEVLKSLLEHSIAADRRQKIDYIDLRIPNRVYYKFAD